MLYLGNKKECKVQYDSMYFTMQMWDIIILGNIKVSEAYGHVRCLHFINDSNTTHGFVTGDGNFPIQGATPGKVLDAAKDRYYMIALLWGTHNKQI